MLEITHVKVYDLLESVVASGNAMRTQPVGYTDEEFQRGLKRMARLCKASRSGDVRCHDNALTGIRVSFDMKYTQYITKQMQRYHWFDYVSSSSLMHRLVKMDLDKASNKYVSKSTIEYVNSYIELYNNLLQEKEQNSFIGHKFTLRDGTVIQCENVEDALYTCYMIILSNCPMGAELFVRISTNYKQLQTMYFQRKNHKLKEDWGVFCKFVESLPHFKELILGQAQEDRK
jgi:hypothetical protein